MELPDISVVDLANETFPIFRNLGGGLFEDATYPTGLAALTIRRSGWSTGFFDLNNDGWKDLFTTCSHVDDNAQLFQATAYKQPNGIFVNLGQGTFHDVSAQAGQDFQAPRAHRGSAFADFNNDGKIDVVVSSLQDSAELWENVSPDPNHWILLKLTGTKSNRDGIGAKVRIGDQHNHMTSACGYASSSHFGVHFGLGKLAKIPSLEIKWPSGITQSFKNVSGDAQYEITETRGIRKIASFSQLSK